MWINSTVSKSAMIQEYKTLKDPINYFIIALMAKNIEF